MSARDFESWADSEIALLQMGINLRRPSDNQSIFKYISLSDDRSWERLAETLSSSYLSGSPVSSLNDPFELAPTVFDDLQPKNIAAAIGYNETFARLQKKEERSIDEIFRDVGPYRKQACSYLDDVKNEYIIVSFCERMDSGLIWAHYANSYQGACLHFLAKGFRYFSRSTLGYVRYSKHRPIYPLSLALSLSSKPNGPRIPTNATALKRAESDQILFFMKADEWSYEAELRLVYEAKNRRA